MVQHRRWRNAGALLLLTLAFTPLTILIHELGHFATPLLFDLPAQLHPTRVSGGAVPDSGAPAALVALQAGGGPLLTLVMSLAGAYLFNKNRQRLWALAFAIAAMSRFAVTTAYLAVRLLVLAQGREFSGQPNFDEHNLAAALSIPTVPVAIAATAFLAASVVWLLRRVEAGSRMLFALALCSAVVIGNLAWAALAPSVLAISR